MKFNFALKNISTWTLIILTVATLATSSTIQDEFSGPQNNFEYVIHSERLPDDLNFMPTLCNGHLGFTVFGDSIFMNGIFNGRSGDSRRARIPNWMSLNASADEYINITMHSSYELNLRDGYIQWSHEAPIDGFRIIQRTFAHRYFNRALIYDLKIERGNSEKPLTIRIQNQPGPKSTAFDFTNLNGREYIPDIENVFIIRGITKLIENADFQKDLRTIYIVLSENLDRSKVLEMTADQKELHFRFIMTADENIEGATKEMLSVLAIDSERLLELHALEWRLFWKGFNIKVKDNIELSQVINAGLFYLANSLPSEHSNQPNHPYYGLSPTGLGRGNRDEDYEGHNFWDTEIWMMPVVTQLATNWTKNLFEYRVRHLAGAMYNSNATGYKGARFPWESAYTGTEATNPCCPIVGQQEIHISADIAFAAIQFYFTTYDREWLCRAGLPLLTGIADFLSSRVSLDKWTGKYHIENVMGPDEDHWNVTDNVYTNVISQYALQGTYIATKICKSNARSVEWLKIAENLAILYDPSLDYHPQHEGYKPGEQIKQADVVLLGYPLQYPMNESTHINDLQIYENVTRSTGPAMTWSIFAINYLDVGYKVTADTFFSKGYKDYVRPEFKVWSETKLGVKGSANFLTGVGGFLQAIMNGYAGIRFNFNNPEYPMEVRRPQLLAGTKGFEINGIKFAESTFSVRITSTGKSNLECTSTGSTRLQLIDGKREFIIYEGFVYELHNRSIKIGRLSESSRKM